MRGWLVGARFERLLIEVAVPAQPGDHPSRSAHDDRVQILGRRLRGRVKEKLAPGVAREHAVENDQVIMDVEVQGTEPLNEVDRAALRSLSSTSAATVAGDVRWPAALKCRSEATATRVIGLRDVDLDPVHIAMRTVNRSVDIFEDARRSFIASRRRRHLTCRSRRSAGSMSLTSFAGHYTHRRRSPP